MSETNAERLKTIDEVIDTIQFLRSQNWISIRDHKNFNKLIRRVQELEKELKECYKQNNNFSNEHWGLQAENKRLREALQYYAEFTVYHLDGDVSEVARKALEGDS